MHRSSTRYFEMPAALAPVNALCINYVDTSHGQLSAAFCHAESRMKVLIVGNMGYIGPVALRHLPQELSAGNIDWF